MNKIFKDIINHQVSKFSSNNIKESGTFQTNDINKISKGMYSLHQARMETINSLYALAVMHHKSIQFYIDTLLTHVKCEKDLNNAIEKETILASIKFEPEKFSLKPDKNKGRALPFKHNQILTGLSIFKDIKVSKCDDVMIVQKFIAGNVGGYFNE